MFGMLDGIVPPLIVVVIAALLIWCRRLYLRRHKEHDRRADVAVVIALVVLTASLEIGMGRSLTYTNGPVRLWVGDVNSDQNSQQISDPYSFTHVIHGVVFYALLWLAAPRLSQRTRFVLAVLIEAAWEVLENTPLIIERYRAVTISLDYYGDSVLNSIADIVAMSLGFEIARRIPVWASVAFVLVIEAALAFAIRDNLTLNILMLVHPIDAIKQWQDGA